MSIVAYQESVANKSNWKILLILVILKIVTNAFLPSPLCGYTDQLINQ